MYDQPEVEGQGVERAAGRHVQPSRAHGCLYVPPRPPVKSHLLIALLVTVMETDGLSILVSALALPVGGAVQNPYAQNVGGGDQPTPDELKARDPGFGEPVGKGKGFFCFCG